MTFSVHIEGLSDVEERWQSGIRDLGGDLRDAVSDACADGKSVARAVAPVRSGDLRKSISGHITRSTSLGGEGEIRVGVSYAAPVVYGSVPHPIPNAFGRGFTVQHPGTKPNDFLAPAELAAEVELDTKVSAAVDKLVAKMT